MCQIVFETLRACRGKVQQEEEAKLEAARWRTSNEVCLSLPGPLRLDPLLVPISPQNRIYTHANVPKLPTKCHGEMHAVSTLQESRLAAEAEVAEIRAKAEAIERETRAKMAALSEVEERQAEREAELGLMVSEQMPLEPWQGLPKHAFVSEMRSEQSYPAGYTHFPEISLHCRHVVPVLHISLLAIGWLQCEGGEAQGSCATTPGQGK